MPCCAIVLTGDNAGLVCGRELRDAGATRCAIHNRHFGTEPYPVAVKELNAYVKRCERIVHTARHGTLGMLLRLANWKADVLVNWTNNMTIPQFHAAVHFPYGFPMDPQMEEMLIAIENAPAPPPPRRARRNPPRRARRNPPRRARADPAPPPPPPPPAPVRELEAFAADKQNIHTTQSVNMTKEVVERVLKIAVPDEYRWNMDTVSKTVGEIIVECKLTAAEMVEMMNRYVRDDDVYNMGSGIYGKVLDGVWQYIRNSPEKADMCRILKQELKDNIGMCAQGNLTRLCNVLAGYMDGIGPQESVAERLGRELPKLMDDGERITKAKTLMKSLNIPETEWAPWLEALA